MTIVVKPIEKSTFVMGSTPLGTTNNKGLQLQRLWAFSLEFQQFSAF